MSCRQQQTVTRSCETKTLDHILHCMGGFHSGFVPFFKLDLVDVILLLKGPCFDLLPEIFPVKIGHVDKVLLMLMLVVMFLVSMQFLELTRKLICATEECSVDIFIYLDVPWVLAMPHFIVGLAIVVA